MEPVARKTAGFLVSVQLSQLGAGTARKPVAPINVRLHPGGHLCWWSRAHAHRLRPGLRTPPAPLPFMLPTHPQSPSQSTKPPSAVLSPGRWSAVAYEDLARIVAMAQRLQAERPPAPGRGEHCREWADAGDPRRGSLAVEGSRNVGLGGVSDLAQRDDAEPRIALARLPQALGPPPSLCPEPRGVGGV